MNREHVVLLHGMGRTSRSMFYIDRCLRKAGFDTSNIGYPPRRPIAELAEHVAARLPHVDSPLHFVTHSMGGIILRKLALDARPENLGRVVMLGPPNRGSRLASWLRNNWCFRKYFGPPGQELGDGPESVPIGLGPVDFDLGVIAGTRYLDPVGVLLRKRNDGRVRVDETKIDGMSQHIELPTSHSFMIFRPAVIRQAIQFLREGCFSST